MKDFITKLASDVVFGIIAALFMYFLFVSVVPQILNTSISLFDGAAKFSFLVDKTKMAELFSVRNNFCILFGIRFIVAYITGGYRIDEFPKRSNDISGK